MDEPPKKRGPKPKVGPKGEVGRARVTTTMIRSSPEWKQAVEELAEADRAVSLSELFDRAIGAPWSARGAFDCHDLPPSGRGHSAVQGLPCPPSGKAPASQGRPRGAGDGRQPTVSS